ncbi:MAG: peptidoglycan hydrolase-like protein with peptidoglycan-binding domain, partial [Crocinitomicaceae bacterium]
QTQEELNLQYKNLLIQLVELLQQQLPKEQSEITFKISEGEVCALAYAGQNDILSIQQELQNQGYSITKVDGKIGAETRAAVSAFQSSAGAEKVDGLIGEETRRLLSERSVACIGDVGVSFETTVISNTNAVCQFAYKGSSDILTIQQELQNQGYSITKVDGKIGPETRTAVTAFQTAVSAEKIDGLIGQELRRELSRTSLECSGTSSQDEIDIDTPTATQTPPVVRTETVTPSETQDPQPEETQTEASVTISSDQITAAARSTTTGIPDDTAVFTYILGFDHTGDLFISTMPEDAFSINIYNDAGGFVGTDGIASVVSSAQKIIREDRTSYFRVRNGDTMSLRLSAQPGAGSYYAELAQLSYTTENAFAVRYPMMINYPLAKDQWRTDVISLLN